MSEIQTSNWSETAANNNATPPNGWPEGQAPSTVNDCARELMAAVRRWFGRWHGINESEALVASAGTSTAITVAYSNAPASLFTGLEVGFKVTTTCGDDPTLNINSLGAKNIQKMIRGGYVNLAAGDIAATQHVKVKYDGTLDKWILISPISNVGTVTFLAHKNGTDQTGIASNTDTKVTFGTEEWDTGSYFASSTWTPPAGRYRISACIHFSAGTGDGSSYSCRLYKNGSLHRSGPASIIGAAATVGASVDVIVEADGNDTFEIYARGATGSTLTVSGTTSLTYFCGEAV